MRRLTAAARAYGVALLWIAASALAESESETEAPSPLVEPALQVESAPRELTLAAGTEVRVRLEHEIGSNLSKRGEKFRLVVVAPVKVDGQIVIPAGASAEGEIIHAEKAGWIGKAGELIATARRAFVGAREVPLRSFLADNGKGRTDIAGAVSIAIGLPGIFIRGGNIVIPSGTEMVAVVAADAVLEPLPTSNTETPPDA